MHVEPPDIGLMLHSAATRGISLNFQYYKLCTALISQTFKSRVSIQWEHVSDQILECATISSLKKHLYHS